MKKQLVIAVMTLIPAVSFAKISDFDAMINDNVKAQGELHSTVKTNLHDAKEATEEGALNAPREPIVVVENSGVSYNAPTKKDMLAFKKERRNHRASEEKQFDRLANEIRSGDE
jgi:hypothetical protein